jgi:predicted amidohydrolase
MPVLKLCFAQINSIPECPEENLNKAFSLAKEASLKGSDMIIFPEQSATGWNPVSDENISDDMGCIPQAFRNIAKDNSIGVLGSFRETGAENPRNTSVFFDEAGVLLAKYSKIHLFNPGGENKCFSPGDKPSIFTYKNVRFGLAICYDLRFSDLFTYYAKVGCECVIIQAAWPKLRMNHWETLIHSRAIENQYFVAGVNTTGKTPVDEYFGGSLLVSPAGEALMKADEKEGLYYAEIDSSLVLETRKKLDLVSDRRDDLYIGWKKNRF